MEYSDLLSRAHRFLEAVEALNEPYMELKLVQLHVAIGLNLHRFTSEEQITLQTTMQSLTSAFMIIRAVEIERRRKQ